LLAAYSSRSAGRRTAWLVAGSSGSSRPDPSIVSRFHREPGVTGGFGPTILAGLELRDGVDRVELRTIVAVPTAAHGRRAGVESKSNVLEIHHLAGPAATFISRFFPTG